ncbi:MAG: diguanylate cyclase, partial [Chloroflexi bacterium]|nr:diguanylate cyclase [Chloroflexota bacterium]
MTIWALFPLITCLAYIILFALSLPSIKKRPNRVFAFYLAISAIWSFTSFMLHLNAFPQQAMFWNEALTVALIWTLIAYYHFIRAYTNRLAGKGVYLGYVLLLGLAILCFRGYIVQYSYVIDGVLYHSLGNSIYFIGAIGLVFVSTCLYLLVKRYRSSTDPTDRNKTMYLIMGWSILVLLTYSNLIPAVSGLPLDHVGSFANALIITYAISRFNLLDVRFVVRRGLTFLLAIICLGGVYVGLILLEQNFFPGQPVYSIIGFPTLLVLLLALLAQRLRYGIKEWIDRLFY